LRREADLDPWVTMDDRTRAQCRTIGLVPLDYPFPVASDWPDLLEIVERLAKPERAKQKRAVLRDRWWQYAEKRPGMRRAIRDIPSVIVVTQTSPHLSVSFLKSGLVYDQKLVIFAKHTGDYFSILQSRVHEIWAREFSSTLEDRLSYTPSDCFATFPLPCVVGDGLTMAGNEYARYRAASMVSRNEGLTRIYNYFHDPADQNPDIINLRNLHHLMDQAVLRGYGWDDLADTAAPVFLTEETEDDHRYQGRLFWPAAFRNELIGRLLALNAERGAEERRAGPGVADPVGFDEEADSEAVAE
jgi:hypothetical protein